MARQYSPGLSALSAHVYTDHGMRNRVSKENAKGQAAVPSIAPYVAPVRHKRPCAPKPRSARVLFPAGPSAPGNLAVRLYPMSTPTKPGSGTPCGATSPKPSAGLGALSEDALASPTTYSPYSTFRWPETSKLRPPMETLAKHGSPKWHGPVSLLPEISRPCVPPRTSRPRRKRSVMRR